MKEGGGGGGGVASTPRDGDRPAFPSLALGRSPPCHAATPLLSDHDEDDGDGVLY